MNQIYLQVKVVGGTFPQSTYAQVIHSFISILELFIESSMLNFATSHFLTFKLFFKEDVTVNLQCMDKLIGLDVTQQT